MEVNTDGFISALNLRISGDKGWLITTCLFCHKRDKLGVLLFPRDDHKPHFHCFKCGKAGSIRFLANHIGRPDLVSGVYIAPMDIGLKIETEIITEVEECRLPVGFRRTKDHPYLDKRSISPDQRELYKFGVTKIDPKVSSDYMITLVEEDGKCVGYVARSTKDKAWIDEYNRTHDDEYPRYKNSESDFSKLILGIDEIKIGDTHTMVLVEGAYDKWATDRKLKLDMGNGLKCGCSFGTKLSDAQAIKIAMKGVENVVILYDAGTINKSKKVSKLASSYFRSVKVGTLVGGDPDEIEASAISEAISNAQSVTEHSLSELEELEL